MCANVPSILSLQHWLNGSNPQRREAIEALTVSIHVGCQKKKIKENKIQNVIGGESDESDVKIKEKQFGKQNRKEDETKLNKEGGENNDENDKKNFRN